MYGVNGDDIKKALQISGHKWILQGGYNAYPLRSIWALVATFPGMGMSPGVIKLWHRLNGDAHKVDIHTEFALDIPRLNYDNLVPNREGKRRIRPVQVAGIQEALRMKGYILGLDTRLGKTLCYYGIHLLHQAEKNQDIKSLVVTKK